MRGVVCALALAGCSVPPEAGFPDVQRTLGDRTGQQAYWHRDDRTEQAIISEVKRLLREPLTPARAVRVALVNNRELQATYEELGVAQADLVQAGMLGNPSLGVDVRLPTTGELVPNVEGDLGIDFMSFFVIAARKRIAEAHFEEAKLRVSHDVLELCADVTEAYHELQAAQQLAAVNLTLAQAAQGSYDSATAMHHAGNLSDLRLAEEQGLYESARLELLESQSEVTFAREKMNRLLGLWGSDAQSWKVTEPLAGIPRDEVSLSRLERLAIGQRLDLAAAKRRTGALAESLGLAKNWGWLHIEEVGAAAELEDGLWKVGPHAEVQLPLFDQGQAQVAARRAEFRQSHQRVTALAVNIRSEVRVAREQLLMHRRKAEHYRDVVIPLRERIVELTLEQYNFMLTGVFELLEKKKEEAEAYREYVRAVRDYWIARGALARTVGGKLPRPRALSKAPSPPPKREQHHGH